MGAERRARTAPRRPASARTSSSHSSTVRYCRRPLAGAQPAGGRAVLQQRHPVAALQVVLGDRGRRPDRGVQHRRAARDPAGARRPRASTSSSSTTSASRSDRVAATCSSPGAQRDPPVDAAQPVAGRERAYPGQLAALARAAATGGCRPGRPRRASPRPRRTARSPDRPARRGPASPTGRQASRPPQAATARGRRADRRAGPSAAPSPGSSTRSSCPGGTVDRERPVGVLAARSHGERPGADHDQVVRDHGPGWRRSAPASTSAALDQVLLVRVDGHLAAPTRGSRRSAERRAERERRGQHHQVDPAQHHAEHQQQAGEQHRPARAPGSAPRPASAQPSPALVGRRHGGAQPGDSVTCMPPA